MKIYTKGGDKGYTSLLGGTRVPKNDERIEAYGTIDELISWIGLLRDKLKDERTEILLAGIQDKLMHISALLADEKNQLQIPGKIAEPDISLLEKEIDAINLNLPPLNSFIIPGGHETVSFCHIARCVCRRAERRLIPLLTEISGIEIVVKYLNRLSDYLFILCRKTANNLGVEEFNWNPGL